MTMIAGGVAALAAVTDDGDTLAIGPFELAPARQAVRLRGAVLALAPGEAALLAALVERRGAVVPENVLVRFCAAPAGAGGLYERVAAVNRALAAHAPDIYAMQVGAGYALKLPVGDAPRRVLFGRAAALAALGRLLAGERLVSIVGPGGIGKTSVALALAQQAGVRDGAHVLDLAAMPDARHLLPALAQVLGMPDGATGRERDLAQRFGALLAGRSTLLVLDGCEHMIDAAACAAELLLAAAPGVTVLATSREALRADGERVYRLAAMGVPPPGANASEIRTAPAVRLFAARAFGERDLAPDELDPVAALCRGLDGLPLALELAAALTPSLGLEALALRLDQHLLDRDPQAANEDLDGMRSRHLSLGAMLASSYDLLGRDEQAVFRRLSVFRGGFTLDAAAAVAGDPGLALEDVKEIVIGLMAKSLVSVAPEPGARPRLLDTTRAYAARLHAADADRAAVRARHADWLRTLLESAHGAWMTMGREAWLASHAPWLDDLRAALDWTFGADGDGMLGVRLTALGFPLAEQAGAGLEFGGRVAQALEVLSGTAEPAPLLRLRLAGFTWDSRSEAGGSVSSVLRAHANALHDVRAHSEAQIASGVLMARWCVAFGSADYPAALATAHDMAQTARAQDDPVLAQLGRKALSQSLHFMGRHEEALAAAQAAVGGACSVPLGYVTSPVPTRVAVGIVMARTHWLGGDAARAASACADAMARAEAERPMTQCHVLAMAALPIALWARDLAACEPLLAQLEQHARRYSFGLWHTWAAFYRDVLACMALAPGAGRRSLALACAERIAARDGKQSDHLATFDPDFLAPAALERVLAGRVGWCAPETLRAHAGHLLADGDGKGARAMLRRALALATEQGALAWQLRIADWEAVHGPA